LEPNLQQIFSLPCKYTVEVFVVDNGSKDGSAKMVREKFPQVNLIQNDWDAGFAGPNNQALRLAKGKVILLLNPDMLIQEGALDRTYELLTQEKKIGVLGIRLNNEFGKPIGSVRRLPTLGSQLAVILKLARFFPSIISFYMYEDFDYSKSQEVPQVRGSYFSFRRELLDTVGYLDDRYHIWFEEVDYCRRVTKQGLSIFYEASVCCQDFVGCGFAKMKHLEKQFIFTDSMRYYFWKWHPWWQAILISFARPIGIMFAAFADIFERVFKKKV